MYLLTLLTLFIFAISHRADVSILYVPSLVSGARSNILPSAMRV